MSTVTSIPRVRVDQFHGRVDFAILTIREDEERAILEQFSPIAIVDTGYIGSASWPYAISYLELTGGYYTIATVRCLKQGTNEAQRVAEHMIRDLRPAWLLPVGIAGAVPDNEFSLGDVILPNHVYDLTVTAALPGGEVEYASSGGGMPMPVEQFLAGLGPRGKEFEGWDQVGMSLPPRPPVNPDHDECQGDADYVQDVRKSLRTHFGGSSPRQHPIYTVRPIASSSQLVRDGEKIKFWRKFMRPIAAIEMEFAGVYTAARGQGPAGSDLPVLTVRGISDIVGLKRDARWTDYARHSAAMFTRALIERGQTLPLRPGHPTKTFALSAEIRVAVKSDVIDAPNDAATIEDEDDGQAAVAKRVEEVIARAGFRPDAMPPTDAAAALEDEPRVWSRLRQLHRPMWPKAMRWNVTPLAQCHFEKLQIGAADRFGRTAIVAALDELHIIDLIDHTRLFTLEGVGPRQTLPVAAAVSDDSAFAAVAWIDNTITVLNVPTCEAVASINVGQAIHKLQFVPGLRQLIVGARATFPLEWDWTVQKNPGSSMRVRRPQHLGFILDFDITPRGSGLISIGTDNRILWWPLREGQTRQMGRWKGSLQKLQICSTLGKKLGHIIILDTVGLLSVAQLSDPSHVLQTFQAGIGAQLLSNGQVCVVFASETRLRDVATPVYLKFQPSQESECVRIAAGIEGISLRMLEYRRNSLRVATHLIA